ncbi:MAG: uroporphyrinogen decarboxylase family protein [Candidatus Jordarchaeum sp.]|uniref:uroporphyrinogen decarboxylase family protein n=1 Tax=Candidatus Jordarchaeum sp. TaxID=2823881 RepID=UPI0040493550
MDRLENVIRAIEFEAPDWVPVYRLLLNPENPWIESDFVEVLYTHPRGWKPRRKGEDEWGCVWENLGGKTMGNVVIPPITSWNKLEDYEFPDPYLEERFIDPIPYQIGDFTFEIPGAEHQISTWAEDRYVLGNLDITLFQRLQFLRGADTILKDLYLEREMAEELADQVTDFYLGIIEMWSSRGAHGVIAYDDFGTQQGLWMRPKIWREFFKPRYKKMIKAAHNRGMRFFLHSCGYIYDIIQDLVEIKLDVLQLDQPELSGVDRLGKEFGGKMCFFCVVDIQKTLQTGTREEIEKAAKHMIEALGSFDGGFMGRAYPQPEAIDLKPENVDVMIKAFRNYGKYPRRIV